MTRNPEITNIDAYIAACPPEVQEKLTALRETIRKAAPEAKEKISWDMPTFYQYGNLVHFAAFAKHIGFYPGDSGVSNFEGKLGEYKTSKGTVQFPLSKPIPYDLVAEITKFRVEENAKKEAEKKGKGK